MSTPLNTTERLEHREHVAQFGWTVFILGFFLVQAIIWIVAITLTSNDPSHALSPEYDSDPTSSRSWTGSSPATGPDWQITLAVDPDEAGEWKQISLKLTGVDGVPEDDATLDVFVFHKGRARVRYPVEMENLGNGTYEGKFRATRTGYWRIHGQLTINQARSLIDHEFYLGEF